MESKSELQQVNNKLIKETRNNCFHFNIQNQYNHRFRQPKLLLLQQNSRPRLPDANIQHEQLQSPPTLVNNTHIHK